MRGPPRTRTESGTANPRLGQNFDAITYVRTMLSDRWDGGETQYRSRR
jgi:hypothetical protein